MIDADTMLELIVQEYPETLAEAAAEEAAGPCSCAIAGNFPQEMNWKKAPANALGFLLDRYLQA